MMLDEPWRRITKGSRWGYWVQVGSGVMAWSAMAWRPTFDGAERASYKILRQYMAWKKRNDWEVTYRDV